MVTIQRVEKKRKKRSQPSQPRQAEVHNISNILSQLSPVAPPELPSQWNSWAALAHQTPSIYNNTVQVPQYEPVAPLSQPNVQQNFYTASSAEAWRTGPTYPQFESFNYNNSAATAAAQSNQTQHPLQATPNLEVPVKTEEPVASKETRAGSVSISKSQLECLRLLSCQIVKNEMTEAQAAIETGLSEEIIKTWVGSLEDILETNKAAVEKANKYDVLVVHYDKMRKAVWNLGKEFHPGDDPVDLSL